MLRLLDDLVIGVAELGRSVRERVGELEQAALEDALELQTGLHLRRRHVAPDAGTRLGGKRAVPLGRTERLLRGELEARISRIERQLAAVPRDVLIGIVALPQ